MIDRELSARASAKVDDQIGALQLQGQAYTHYLARRSRHFSDVTLQTEGIFEDLFATRIGGAAVVAHPLGRRGRWSASVTSSHDRARVISENSDGVKVGEGDVTMVEAAGGLKYETTRWQLDGAVGLAIPAGIDASPWPEVRLVTKYRPRKDLELVATGGHKGRVPSLRERFDSVSGNPELDPEKAWHAELRAIEHLGERLRVEVAPFYRRTTGAIRTDPRPPTDGEPRTLINLGLTNLLGIDTQARYQPHRMLELGGSYGYSRIRGSEADGPYLEMHPLDRFPTHRADGWVQVTPDARISMLARVKYFGESWDKNDPTMPVAGYTTFEATVSAPVTKQYLAVLRMDDVTNVRPETRKGYHTAGRVISLIVQGTWE
jgi:outer membrane receptor protein involved in Fe transport